MKTFRLWLYRRRLNRAMLAIEAADASAESKDDTKLLDQARQALELIERRHRGGETWAGKPRT